MLWDVVGEGVVGCVHTGRTRLVYYRAFPYIDPKKRPHLPLVAAEVDEGLRDVLLEAALGNAPHLIV